MNRENKFRIWNGIEMIYDVMAGKFGVFYVNPGEKGDGLDVKDSASITPFNTKYSDTTPLMRFTGVLDKDQNEIWEDDIVGVEYGFGRVVFKSGCFMIEWIDDPEANLELLGERCLGKNIFRRREDLIVVGNVHQNTGLISSHEKRS